MQFPTLMTLATGAALTSAAPLEVRTSLPVSANIVFHGAADAAYSLTVPLDGSLTYTYNPLSISSVSSYTIDIGAQCKLNTVDYPPALVQGPANTWVVGPPQTVISISCVQGSSPPPPPPAPTSIVIEFDGADPSEGAFYKLTVPLDGSSMKTNNVLSISTLVSDFGNLASRCTFVTVDGTNALSKIDTNTWALGPPQTVISVACNA
ncbi:uncharacterized protein RSE6_09964 [Rhynchosporium secalis]|uniref:Ubiquitin 3 binding protein But2 C-terminal domain-containing protein n=1 Tax=Rhynchosporium secalis TaxID=38038 RepID=A0A1E1MJ92_RHYSE|nr:uncharacterized protein RSE6_09964 [Rhynchosporium secalis]